MRKLGWPVWVMLALLMAGGCGGFEELDETGVEAQQQGLDVINLKANVPFSARWIASSGVEFVFDGHTFLVDPYFTRAADSGTSSTPVHPQWTNWDLIDNYLKKLNDNNTPVQHILVSHTHWDHAADVPYIAKKSGAKVYGTQNVTSLMAANGAASQAVAVGASTFTVHDNPYNGRRVEVTSYIWKHNKIVVLPEFITLQEGKIDPTTPPATVGDYKYDGYLAFKLKFFDGGKVTTVFVAGPLEHSSITTVKSSPSEKFDVVFLSLTDWNKEEKDGVDQILSFLQPDLVVPIHQGDYYTPLKDQPEPIYDVVDRTTLSHDLEWNAATGHWELDYVITTNHVEFGNFVKHIQDDHGVEVAVPKMFAPLIGGASDPLAGYAGLYDLIKAKDPATSVCFRDVNGAVVLGGCTNTTLASRWRYEPSGIIRNLTTGKCIRRSGSSVVLDVCDANASTWIYTNSAGLLYTMNGSEKLCLRAKSMSSGQTVGIAACNCHDDTQKWALLTATRIDVRPNRGLGMARDELGVNYSDPIYVEPRRSMITETSNVVHDRGAFIYEPATGYLRVADNPARCIYADKYGSQVSIQSCTSSTQSYVQWSYSASSGLIKSQADTSACLGQVVMAGEPMVFLGSCTTNTDADKAKRTWSLDVSRGVPTGAVGGTVSGALLISGAYDGIPIGIAGCDCDDLKTDIDGKYECPNVPTGTQQVAAVPPCLFANKTLSATVNANQYTQRDFKLDLAPYSGKGTLYGNVYYGKLPLNGVTVGATAKYTTITRTTNGKGFYCVPNLPLGIVSASYVKKGYVTQTKSVSFSSSAYRLKRNIYMTRSLSLLLP